MYSSSEKEACERDLRGCYRESLELVGRAGVAGDDGKREDGRTVEVGEDTGEGVSIAFSCISTGVYGYPSRDAAHVACRVVRDWLAREEQEKMKEGRKRIERVIFCLFEEKDVVAYQEVLP